MRDVPAGIELRRATPDDIEMVIGLGEAGIATYREWAPDFQLQRPTPQMRERLTALYGDDERAWIMLALEADEAVGVAALSTITGADARVPPEGTVYLWQMFVRRDRQGSGLAGALLDRLLEEARRRGYRRIVLWTPAGAAQARRFYEREGFELTGEEDPDSHFGLPLVRYGRDL
ncbi:MAG TPA: GNAT family N-acetyltransferase [Thermoleophilaceae bacterium]